MSDWIDVAYKLKVENDRLKARIVLLEAVREAVLKCMRQGTPEQWLAAGKEVNEALAAVAQQDQGKE